MRVIDAEIVTIRAAPRTHWRHVVLQTDEGVTGVGEFTHDKAPQDISTLADQAARSLIGRDAKLPALEHLRPMVGQGLAQASVYSALEQALTDIEAQATARPIWRLLTNSDAPGTPDPVKLYANINRRTIDRSPEGFATSAMEAEASGFDAIKIAPFDGLSPDLCRVGEGGPLIEAGMQRIERLSETLKPSTEIMVDCHWRFDKATALAILDRLSRARVTWFECPLPEIEDMIDDIKSVRSAANVRSMRLAGLETAAAWQGFAPFVEAGAYDVVMPDVKHAGGFSDIMDIANRTRPFGASVSLHNPSGPIAHVASVHATIGIGGQMPLELQFDESPKFWSITDPPPAACPGQTIVPDGTGLGVVLRSDLKP